jgi:hypothetical protein
MQFNSSFFAIFYNAENIFGPLQFHFEQVLLYTVIINEDPAIQKNLTFL